MKKNISRKAVYLLLLAFAFLLAGCNSNSSKFSSNIPTKNLPEAWKITDSGLTFDSTERENFFISEEVLANQDFQYATDVSFAESDRGTAALVFQASEDGKNCYAAMIDARTNKAKEAKGLVVSGPLEVKDGKLTMEVYVDRSLVEGFFNDSKSISIRSYAAFDSQGVSLEADGDVTVTELYVAEMKSIY